MGVNCSGDTGGRRVGVVDARPRLFPAAPCGGITKREKRNTYVQIVRFEGAQENWDERIEEVGNRIRGGGEGSPMAEVRGAVKRAMTLVDRENGRGAGVTFCESEEDLRRVEEAMPACRRGDAGVCRDLRGRGRRVALVAWGQHSPRVPLSRRGYSSRRKCPLRVRPLKKSLRRDAFSWWSGSCGLVLTCRAAVSMRLRRGGRSRLGGG